MRIVKVRRYPVKSMGGESMDSVEVTHRGLRGDRFYAVHTADGRFASGKNGRRHRLHDDIFDYSASLTDHGVEITRDLSDGHATTGRDRVDAGPAPSWIVGDPGLNAELRQHLGAEVALRPEQGFTHFDAAPISLIGSASLDWCRDEYDVDARSRRLRVNLVVDTQEPWVEDTWVPTDADDPGLLVTIGSLRFRPLKRIVRCRMVDLAQDGVTTVTPWLRALKDRSACAGIYLEPLDEGVLHVGDAVTISAV